MTEVVPGTAEYWDSRYSTIGEQNVSWFQADPETSQELIVRVSPPGGSVVDVGGGASRLVDSLLAAGYRDLTVVDISPEALRTARERVGEAPVAWIVSDIREWQPARSFDLWHDRAAYHFLVDPADQQRYWQLVRDAVALGGHVVIATFADDGPDMCSGLPVTRYGVDELASAMGSGFRVLDSRREEHTTPAGGTQSFSWVLAERV
jgi:SAM-dependent methyltransferase